MTGGHEGGNPTDSTSAAEATSSQWAHEDETTCADKGVDDDEGRAT